MIDTAALRKKVLDLAIQGKLTEQLPSDGTAEELYAKIQEEKARLIKEGKIKKEKPLPAITEKEIPFDIPKNWKWVRLGEICLQITDGTHKTPTYQEDGVPFLSVKNISSGFFDLTDIKYIPKEEHAELIKRCKPEKNDVLVCRIGTLGKAITIDIDLEFSIFVSLGLIKTTCKTISDYLVLVINSGYCDTWINDNKAGGAMHTYKINLNSLSHLPFPLAPIPELERILQKTNNIKLQTDSIQNLQSKYIKDSAVLKTKILDAAIQGKLVEQRAEEGTAEELYKQIRAEKQKLIKEGKIKKEKPLPEISVKEIPFDIPESWIWVRWGNLSQKIQYGYNAPALPEGRIKMVRITDIQDEKVVWETVPYCNIPEEDISSYLLKENDILFARTGGTVGKSFLVDKVPEDAIYAGYLIRSSYSEKICPQYIKIFMGSGLYWDQLRSGTIATAQPNCNGQTLSKMILPLPPLAEQRRIVARIEELLPLCERLAECREKA